MEIIFIWMLLIPSLFFLVRAFYSDYPFNIVQFYAGTLIFFLFTIVILGSGITYQSGEIYTYTTNYDCNQTCQLVVSSMDYNYSTYTIENNIVMHMLNMILPATNVILVGLAIYFTLKFGKLV